MSYVRIYSFKVFPQKIQKEILKYPSTIKDDSEYEDDERVMEIYKDDPVKYIQ